jgi:hypothetical protein
MARRRAQLPRQQGQSVIRPYQRGSELLDPHLEGWDIREPPPAAQLDDRPELKMDDLDEEPQCFGVEPQLRQEMHGRALVAAEHILVIEPPHLSFVGYGIRGGIVGGIGLTSPGGIDQQPGHDGKQAAEARLKQIKERPRAASEGRWDTGNV